VQKLLPTKLKNMDVIKCIIFDCDGVLVDSEEIGNKVLLSMTKEFGLGMTMKEAIMNFSGRSLKDCFQQIENRINQKLPTDFEKEYRKQSSEAFKTELKPVKGVKQFIDSLSISYCVASSGPVEKIKSNLTITGLADNFGQNIFSSYQINSWKPDPEIFLFASKEMGYSPNECIVIEDSKSGVISAIKGGFKVYGFANANNSQVLQDEGAIVFYSFDELHKLLYTEKNASR
jgi:HAD superfamily hydrolase (TIGR01509 family)